MATDERERRVAIVLPTEVKGIDDTQRAYGPDCCNVDGLLAASDYIEIDWPLDARAEAAEQRVRELEGRDGQREGGLRTANKEIKFLCARESQLEAKLATAVEAQLERLAAHGKWTLWDRPHGADGDHRYCIGVRPELFFWGASVADAVARALSEIEQGDVK